MPKNRSKDSNKDYKKAGRKDHPKKEEYGDLSYGYQGKPKGDDKPITGLSVKSLKGLPHAAFSVQADPYTSALPGSEPYAIINQFNKTIGGSYGGARNLDGGNVQQYANSLRSKLLNATDSMLLKLGINYHYIPVRYPYIINASGQKVQATASDGYPGKALIDEQRRAIAEATSVLQSTTFTQMAIYNYVVATDMPMGSAVSDTAEGINYPIYSDLNDVLFATLRYYQIFLLKVLGVIDWHNSFRLKMGTMIKSAWNREVPRLNSLFGLFKKKSFLSLINSLSMSLPGEYVDREFALQFAKTCLVPSRRANAITEPLLETEVMYNMPAHFEVYIKTGSGSSAEYTQVFSQELDFQRVVAGIEGAVTFDQAVESIMDYLSAEKTLAWARAGEAAQAPTNDNKRFNFVRANFDVIQECMTVFKQAFSDVREVLDTCARTGLVTWYKGFRPSIVNSDDAPLFRNLIVDDIYRLACGGSNRVDFDTNTKRYRTWTMWNMYDGISEFDVYSGGAFLTFSFKEIHNTDDVDLTLTYLPVCLTVVTQDDSRPSIVSVTRKGVEYTTSTATVTLSSYLGTRRLVPLSTQNSLQANVLTVPYPTNPSDVNQVNSDLSFLIRSFVQVTGLCNATNGSNPDVLYQDPDLISVYQIEIEDITNEMVAYARANSPFRGAVNTQGIIGFLGTVAAGSHTTKMEEK